MFLTEDIMNALLLKISRMYNMDTQESVRIEHDGFVLTVRYDGVITASLFDYTNKAIHISKEFMTHIEEIIIHKLEL